MDPPDPRKLSRVLVGLAMTEEGLGQAYLDLRDDDKHEASDEQADADTRI